MVYLINMIETSLFSLFLIFFFNIEHKKRFLLLTFLPTFIISNISSYYEYESVGLTIGVIVLNIIGVLIEKKSIKFEYFFVPIIYNVFVILSALISMITAWVFFKRPINNVAVVLAKVLQLLFTILLLRYKKRLMLSFDIKRWWSVLVEEILLLSGVVLCVMTLVRQNHYYRTLSIVLVLLLLINILFIIFTYISDRNNQIKINSVKELESIKGKKEKYEAVYQLKHEADSLNHRMFYVFWKIELLAKQNRVAEIEEEIKNYRETIARKEFVFRTGNEVFDYFVSNMLSHYIKDNTTISPAISISINDLYDNMMFIKWLNELLDQIIQADHSYTITLSERTVFLVVHIISSDMTIDNDKFESLREYLGSEFRGKMKLHQEERVSRLKVIIPLVDYV